jgi:hypothetical protein
MLMTGCTRPPALMRLRTLADPGTQDQAGGTYGSSLASIWSSAWSTFIHRVSSPGRTMS